MASAPKEVSHGAAGTDESASSQMSMCHWLKRIVPGKPRAVRIFFRGSIQIVVASELQKHHFRLKNKHLGKCFKFFRFFLLLRDLLPLS
jgi:hypothetical protein